VPKKEKEAPKKEKAVEPPAKEENKKVKAKAGDKVAAFTTTAPSAVRNKRLKI